MPLVRLHVRADPRLVEEGELTAGGRTPQQGVEGAVVSSLRKAGVVRDVTFVSEDPTDEGAFSVLATPGERPDADAPGVTVLAREGVADPPPMRRAMAPNLDDSLLVDEARAIALALLKDTDPDRLKGMGDAFAPDLPVVGALLLTRARLENARRVGGQDHHDALNDHRRAVTLARRAKPSVGRAGVGTRGGSTGLATPAGPVEPILAELRKATLDLGPAAASSWDAYAGAIMLAEAEEDPAPIGPPADFYSVDVTIHEPADVERVLAAVLSDPELARTPPTALAASLGTGPSTTAAVCRALRPLGGGVVLVDPVKARSLRAGRPPPSAAAIKLAASTVRPKANGLADPDRVPTMFRALMSAGRRDEASAQVDRGKRAVARRNWVEWYRAAEAAGMLGVVR